MIPLPTTTVTVWRPNGEQDPYVPGPDAEPAFRSVAAHIGAPSGREAAIGGQQSTVTDRLTCDPADIGHGDLIVDDTTGDRYEVVWARRRVGLGVDHMTAGLLQVVGASSA